MINDLPDWKIEPPDEPDNIDDDIEMITEQQELAVRKLNAALIYANKNGVYLAGMDNRLLYATKQAMDKSSDHGYCNVANCVHEDIPGSGYLFSENYDDSGGW